MGLDWTCSELDWLVDAIQSKMDWICIPCLRCRRVGVGGAGWSGARRGGAGWGGPGRGVMRQDVAYSLLVAAHLIQLTMDTSFHADADWRCAG